MRSWSKRSQSFTTHLHDLIICSNALRQGCKDRTRLALAHILCRPQPRNLMLKVELRHSSILRCLSPVLRISDVKLCMLTLA